MSDDVLAPWLRVIAEAIPPAAGDAHSSRATALEVIRSLRAAGYEIGPTKAGNVVEGTFHAGPRLVHDVDGVEPSAGTAGHAVVELLVDALADARSGNITFLALTAGCADGTIQPAWAGEFKPITCLAAVNDLRLRVEAQYLAATDPGGAA